MNLAIGTATGIVRPRTGLRNICAVGVAAAVVAAGLGAAPPSEVHTRHVMHLEATLAASVISSVASVSAPAASNSVAAPRIPTATAAATPGAPLNLGQALLFTGAAALLTPAWYIGFPITIPLTAAALLILLSPFVVAEGGTINLTTVGLAVALGAVGYAILPPAAILGGLVNIGQGLSQALSLPAAATKTKTAASATSSRQAPASTGHSRRATRTQPTAAATPGSAHDRDQSRGTSKKSTTGKRAVGSSGRQR
jgi:hypothetical protein